MQQRRRDGRIDAARNTENDFFLADGFAQLPHRRFDKRLRRPVAIDAADIKKEIVEDFRTLGRMHHFGVKLDAVEMPFFIGRNGVRDIAGRGHNFEPGRQGLKAVAVAHPHLRRRSDAFEKTALAGDIQHRPAIFAKSRFGQLAAQLVGHQLLAVADAEDRMRSLIERLRQARRILGQNRSRAARQDIAPEVLIPIKPQVGIEGHDFAIDVLFPNPAGNQLCVLRPEIEDKN